MSADQCADTAAAIATTDDAFLGGALALRQPARGYRAGIDAVLLAAACSAQAGETVADCGAGIGTVGLALARRVDARVTLIERAPEYVALARHNVDVNALGARVDLIDADLTAPLSRSPSLAARLGTFDHVLANPPYMSRADGTRSADALKDAANAMSGDDLDAWARAMASLLKPSGRALMIHRADALHRVLDAFAGRFGALTVTPLLPRVEAPAVRILVGGVKGSRAPLTLAAPIVLHETDGRYTSAIDAILRGPKALMRPTGP